MNPDIFGLLIVLSLISDMMASLFVAFKLRSLRNGRQTKLVTTLSLVFFGIFMRGLCHMIAEGFGFAIRPVYSVGYGWAYWIGRACLTIPCWLMVFRLVGVQGKLVHAKHE